MKHVYALTVFLIVLTIALSQRATAQSLPRQELYNQVVPPPPNAASLGKFADFPVSLYNGVPQINVPLWTVGAGELTLPISLSYHASGVTVPEMASWVGLGWSLNAGGVITRSVRGLPDDASQGFAVSPQYAACTSSTNPTETFSAIIDPIGRGQIDGEPDLFFFNFGGISGKFVVDRNRQVHLLPFQNLRIKPNGGAGDPFTSWEVTTESGVVYVFSEAEQVQTVIISSGAGAPVSSTSAPYTSWYLTEVRAPGNRQKITLSYTSQPQNYLTPGSETRYELTSGAPCSSEHNNTTTSTTTIDRAKQLASITFPTGSVEFKAGSYRHDLPGGQVLAQVIIKKGGDVIRRFALDYQYFSAGRMTDLSAVTPVANAATPAADYAYLRLALKGIQEFDQGQALTKAPYRFEYETEAWLPNRITSKAQDHWGFYNGADDNRTLIPSHPIGAAGTGAMFNGALRLPIERYAKAASLTKVTYPTGGSTIFRYELNETTQAPYAPDFVRIFSRLGIGHCSATESQTFDINDGVNHEAQIRLVFDGARFPVTLYEGCSDPKFSFGNISSYIHFKLFKVVANPQNPQSPAYVDMLSNQDALFTLGYASGRSEVTLTLPDGHYQLSAVRRVLSGSDVPLPNTDWVEVKSGQVNTTDVYWIEATGLTYTGGANKIGGLRIREMVEYDPVTGKSITKTYAYQSNGLSSGTVNHVPQYNYAYEQSIKCGQDDQTGPAPSVYAAYQVYTSASNAPLSTSQGGNVGYSQVTVYYGKSPTGEIGTGGKTDYFYTSAGDVSQAARNVERLTNTNTCFDLGDPGNSGSAEVFPFAPRVSMDELRGRLAQQVDYKKQNGDYIKVREVVNTYKDDFFGAGSRYNALTDVIGTKAGLVGSYYRNPGIQESKYAVQYYWASAKMSRLVKSVELFYDANGTNPRQTTQELAYDNLAHLQPNRTTLTTERRRIVEQTLYPADYTTTTGFVGEMRQAHIMAKPVEKVRYQTNLDGSNVQILSGTLFAYQQGPQVGLLNQAWTLETAQPVALADFRFSNQMNAGALPHLAGPGDFSPANRDRRYPQAPGTTLAYDAQGNLQQVQRDKDVLTAYVWGYNSTLPVAEVRNATVAQVQAALGVDVNTLTIDQQLRDAFQRVRQQLPAALITSFTHEPLVGMTSRTDPSGRTVYYEYDALGRLVRTRDEQRRIRSQQQYHYAGQ